MADFLKKKRIKSLGENEDSSLNIKNKNFKNKLKNVFTYNENYIFSQIIFKYFTKKIDFKDLLNIFQSKTSEAIKSHINKTKHIFEKYYSEILNENIKKVKGFTFEYLIDEYIKNNSKAMNSNPIKPFDATSGEAKDIINNLTRKDESYQKLNDINYINGSISKNTILNSQSFTMKNDFNSSLNLRNPRDRSSEIWDSYQQSTNINKNTYLMEENVIEFKNDTIKCNINSDFFVQLMNLVKNSGKTKDSIKIFLSEKNKEICFQNMLLNDYMRKMNNFYAAKYAENNHD